MASQTVLATLAGIAIVFLLFVFITRNSRKIVDSFDTGAFMVAVVDSTTACPQNSHFVSGTSTTLTCQPCPKDQMQDPNDKTKCIPASCKPNQYIRPPPTPQDPNTPTPPDPNKPPENAVCGNCPEGTTSSGSSEECVAIGNTPSDTSGTNTGTTTGTNTGDTNIGTNINIPPPAPVAPSFKACDPNFYLSNSMCYECGQNQISNGGSSQCTNLSCEAGEIAKKHECTSCKAGTISSGGNQSICTNCASGTYQDADGQSTCKQCGTGKYSGPKSTSCSTCPPGTSQNNKGSSSCKDCPRGSYQDLAGQETCLKCPINTYSSKTNSTSCTRCPKGHFTVGEGSTSFYDCKINMTVDECPKLYLNTNLSFDVNNPPKGKSKYYNLKSDDFNITPDSYYSQHDSDTSKLAKCVLNQRLCERSDTCKANKGYTINYLNEILANGTASLTQAYEFTNAKGICVDKTGNKIPYPTIAPPGTIGSADAVLSHITYCSDPSNPRTCSYQYVENNMVFTNNPCTVRKLIYDFDKEQCINSTTDTINKKLNYCANNQVSDYVTGNCIDVMKPVNAMPPNTKGAITSSDYKNCKTINGGDCTVVYKTSANQNTELASTTNPCPPIDKPTDTIFNFNKYKCEAPVKSGFQDYRIQRPII